MGKKHALSMEAMLNKGISAVASDSLSEMIDNLHNKYMPLSLTLMWSSNHHALPAPHPHCSTTSC